MKGAPYLLGIYSEGDSANMKKNKQTWEKLYMALAFQRKVPLAVHGGGILYSSRDCRGRPSLYRLMALVSSGKN